MERTSAKGEQMTLNKPKFLHLRRIRFAQPAPKGGVTVCYYPTQVGTVLSAAVCSPKDNYNKAMGRKIALGRAQKGSVGTMMLPMKAESEDDLYKAAHEYAIGILKQMSRQHQAMINELDVYFKVPHNKEHDARLQKRKK
jgi:hypothetical protein